MSRVLLLIDHKSSGFKAFEHRIQVGGYATATHLWNRATEVETDMPAIQYAAVLYESVKGVSLNWLMDRKALLKAGEIFSRCVDLYRYSKEFDPAGGKPSERYMIHGEPYISVTQVMSIAINKPQLLNWAMRLTKEGKDPNQVRDEAAVKGSRMHSILEAFAKGETIEYRDENESRVVAHFSEWLKALDGKPRFVEQIVFHDELGYAGTCDLVVEVDEEKLKALVLQEAMK